MDEIKEFIKTCQRFGNWEYRWWFGDIQVYVSVDWDSTFIEATKWDRTTTVLINQRSRSSRAVPTIDLAVKPIYMILK